MKYKGLLLDIDNTLYRYDQCHERAINKVFSFAKSEFGDIGFREAYEIARSITHISLLGKASSHSRLLYFQKTCEILKINPLKYALNLNDLYWDTFFEGMVLFDGVVNFFEIVSKTTKICFLSDLSAHIQYRKLHKFGLERFVSYIVTSEETGHDKPHPYTFLAALHKLEITPKEACMIGDNFEKDIIGALNVGIDAIWFNHEQKKLKYKDIRVKEVKTFSEILELI